MIGLKSGTRKVIKPCFVTSKFFLLPLCSQGHVIVGVYETVKSQQQRTNCKFMSNGSDYTSIIIIKADCFKRFLP